MKDKLILLLIPPLVITYLIFGLPLRSICENGDFHWITLSCSLNMGQELEKQGFSPIISGDLPDCETLEKGWCVKEKGEMITLNVNGQNILVQMATVTPKGFNLAF